MVVGGKFNLTLKGKMTSFSVVLGIFRPYFNSFRSYYVEMRQDNQFFGLFRGFLYEIGEIIVVLGNFRLIPEILVLLLVALDLMLLL